MAAVEASRSTGCKCMELPLQTELEHVLGRLHPRRHGGDKRNQTKTSRNPFRVV
jgi:hypothetical protein